MSDWNQIETAPSDKALMTKIDDASGSRNEQALYRSGNMWWTPDGGMYVYYRPTHWRELTTAERRVELEHIAAKALNNRGQAARANHRLMP